MATGEEMANLSAAYGNSSSFTQYFKSAKQLEEPLHQDRFPSLQVLALQKVLPKGLSRGLVVEVHGKRSSGRTSIALLLLAKATQAGEVVAVVDLFDTFSPGCAFRMGVDLDRVVWTRCKGNPEYAMRTSDLLLHAGGFGLIILDLCEASPKVLNRIPLSYWYRFRKAIEHTSTVLLVCADRPQAKVSIGNQLQTKTKAFCWSETESMPRLCGLETSLVPDRVSAIRPPSLFLQAIV